MALTPPRRIVEAITCGSPGPAFAGEMRMEATHQVADGTSVSVGCTDLPPGIRPEDNGMGAQSALGSWPVRRAGAD